MGSALLGGLLESGIHPPGEVCVVEIDQSRREQLAAEYRGLVVSDAPVRSEGTVVAVKPLDVPEALRAAVGVGTSRVLSLAAGVATATLCGICGDIPVVRAMPNTPALVRSGVTALAAGPNAGELDMHWAEQVMGAVGSVVRVPESLMDAVTGLSGSGPAYVFLVAEALVEAGVAVGLPRDVAHFLVRETLAGSARMLATEGAEPSRLRADVTSPGGTTAAALAVLERGATRAAFIDAVRAATRRSAELEREVRAATAGDEEGG